MVERQSRVSSWPCVHRFHVKLRSAPRGAKTSTRALAFSFLGPLSPSSFSFLFCFLRQQKTHTHNSFKVG